MSSAGLGQVFHDHHLGDLVLDSIPVDSRSPLALQDCDILRVKIAPEIGHFLESAGVPIGCGHFEVFAMGG